ncbi:MAG: hypothetical protein WBM08_09140 [Prochlorococcaceae cyanobacterium]|jgi:hypothetical protein
MAEPLWLVRPRRDGGCDYVRFLPTQERVEVREGSHLPPQMPLLKHRQWVQRAEAEAQSLQLQQEGGYRCSEPLF